MRKLLILAAISAAATSPVMAQDAPQPTADTTPTSTATAPDGSRAFGIEPYFGVMGGWEQFDSEGNRAGVPQGFRNNKLNGSLVQGVAGINLPLGPVFVGAEGEVSKGVSGDIDWEYGAAGRVGFRAGESGLIYGRVGYRWVNFAKRAPGNRDFNDITYGAGFEVGPKSIGLGGITGESGIRLRGEVTTFGNAHSIRPMLGLITHF